MTKKKNINTKALSGCMELLPEEQIIFNKMFETIRQTYELFGFVAIDTPILERAVVLLAKAGGDTEKQIYRFKKGDNDLAMRFDLTVPLSRYVVEHYGQITFPFRRYAMSKVYRGERPQAGRFREFYQCDIDVVGNGELDISYDAEIPSVIYSIFRSLGFDKFTIRINNRKLFDGLFSGLGIEKQSTSIMQAIDKLEKIGEKKVKEELLDLEISEDDISKIFSFLNLDGSTEVVLEGLSALGLENDQFRKGLEELTKVVELVGKFGVPDDFFKIDLGIARGLDYYTGTVYETQLDEYPDIGSVCSGGRYDDLASSYTERRLPGVGISIGLTRLFDQLIKKGVIKAERSSSTQVLLLPMTDDLSHALELARELRDSGICTEVSFAESKMKKRLSYANKLGIPFAVFIGSEEIEKGVYAIKNLSTGEQKELTREELLSLLKK